MVSGLTQASSSFRPCVPAVPPASSGAVAFAGAVAVKAELDSAGEVGPRHAGGSQPAADRAVGASPAPEKGGVSIGPVATGDHFQPVILLCLFAGIDVGAWAAASLGFSVLAHAVWETDPDAIATLRANFPHADFFGDVFQDPSPAQYVRSVLGASRRSTARVLALAGPPCPDFSRIRGPAAPGFKGTAGRKFLDLVPLLHELRAEFGADFLVENESWPWNSLGYSTKLLV